MVIVAFPPGEKYAVNYTTLDQYDYGQILRIQGLKLPKTVEVHFSTQETGGTSITRVGVTKDGVTDVLIPDSVLENGDTTQNYSIFAFVYVTDATSGKTEYRARLEVKARPKPEVPGGGDNPDIFHEAVLEVRKSAEKAEEAQRQAEGWAHGREDLPERAEDNAMYYAGKASEDARRTATDRTEVERLTESNTQMQGEVAKDLEEVKKFSSQAQTSATNAALSEQKSKEAATRAETAQTGAETAEGNAELAAQKTGQDKAAVEQAKNLVQQMGQEVLNNKNAVDKTAQDFTLKAQQALADVNNAGQTQTERVQTAGTTAVENIENAQNTATQAVETAKTEAIKAVQTEGTTQTGNVTAEGEKQVQAVQTAAQEIIADRKQIAKNKTDIADLRQNKADAIVETASGTLLNVKDSAYAKIVNLKINKNVNWVKITGKNLLNVQGEKTGNNINLMEFGTGRIKYTTQDDYGGGYVAYAQVFKAGTYMFSAKITKDGESEKGIRLGFNKEVEIKNNRLIYNSYYKHYFMQEYAKTIEITSNEEFALMIALNSVTAVKGSVIEISEIQMEQGNTVTNYESYCEEQNVVAPITEDKLNTLHTNYPTTIISNSENAEMQLTYIADTKNYYLGREEILQKQILEIQNALISQKISGGGIIQVKDSVKLPIQNLRVFGKSEQNGVPAPDAPVPIVNVGEKGNIKINITGKNLVQGRMYYVNYSNGTLFVSDINREVRLPYAPERETQGIGYVIPCRAGKTYTVSVKNPNENATVAIAEYADINMAAKHANALGRSQPRPDNVSYTAKSDGIIVCGIAGVWTNGTTTIHKCTESELLQVEEGAMATEYEVPAEHQSLALFTPNGLLGLKVEENGNYTDENGQQWIADEIDLARGKYVQRIRKLVLDGNIDTKHVGQHENGTKYLGIILQEKDYTLKASNMLCTRYIRAEWTNKNGYVYSAKKDTVFITDNRFTDSETTKKIIDEEKPVIIYPLLTPIETDLPPETISAFKKIHTNHPNTIVSNNADAGMELTYTVDTQSYIDDKIAEVSKALL